MVKAFKLVRYFVARHQNRDGTLSRRIWDVREVTVDEFAIEHIEAKIYSAPSRKEAEEYAKAMNTVARIRRENERRK